MPVAWRSASNARTDDASLPVIPASASVVVATKDRPQSLARCLALLSRQTLPVSDIVVVDNGSMGRETERVVADAGSRYMAQTRGGLSAARNRGAAEASGDIVAYLDDDCEPEPGWLEAIVDGFGDPEVQVVTGRILPLEVANEAQEMYEYLGGFDVGPEPRSVDKGSPHWFEIVNFGGIGLGGNMAVRREVFAIWPGFRESLGLGAALHGAEEQHAFFSVVRRGGRIRYEPSAVVRHPLPSTWAEVRRRHLRDLERVAGYCSLLFVEEPEYRVRVARYVLGGLFRRPRRWRHRPTRETPSLLTAGDLARTAAHGLGMARSVRQDERERREIATPGPGRVDDIDLMIVTPDYPPALGGIQHFVHRLASLSRCRRVRVVAPSQPDDQLFDSGYPRVQVVRTRIRRGPSRAFLVAVNVRAVFEAWRRRPDVIVSAHIVTSPAGWLANRLLGCRWMVILYADEVPSHKTLSRFAVRRATTTLVISEHTRRLAMDVGADPERVRLLPPGVDLPLSDVDRTPRELHGNGGPPTILTVARLADRYKGHDKMIDALPLVLEHVPDARWVVVGDGPLRAELDRAVERAGLSSSVVFAGAVSDAELETWFRAADVFVMVSRLPPHGGGEGFGIVYLEAGARGVPVVAGGVGGATDAVTEETGILVDPTEPAHIAQAITTLLEDRELSSRLGDSGRERAHEFAWPAIARRFDGLLVEMAGSGSPDQ